jgi:glyoxylase-like metal-dependent hydrolase (beta-lactamase superfamily II)
VTCDEIYLMTVGYEFMPRSWILEGETDDVTRQPLTALLARSDGRWFLFDTGLGPEARDIEFTRHIGYVWGDPEIPDGNDDPLISELGKCGVSLDEVDVLVMSHLHVDHTGGVPYFADGRPVYIQGAELDFGLSHDADGFYRAHYDDPNLAWHRLTGDAEIASGIRAISTPGHTPGHMSYLIELPESGPIVFPFDAVPTMENVDRDSPIVGTEAQKPLIRESHDRIVELARSTGARLLPGHCPRTWPALDGQPVQLR